MLQYLRLMTQGDRTISSINGVTLVPKLERRCDNELVARLESRGSGDMNRLPRVIDRTFSGNVVSPESSQFFPRKHLSYHLTPVWSLGLVPLFRPTDRPSLFVTRCA